MAEINCQRRGRNIHCKGKRGCSGKQNALTLRNLSREWLIDHGVHRNVIDGKTTRIGLELHNSKNFSLVVKKTLT